MLKQSSNNVLIDFPDGLEPIFLLFASDRPISAHFVSMGAWRKVFI